MADPTPTPGQRADTDLMDAVKAICEKAEHCVCKEVLALLARRERDAAVGALRAVEFRVEESRNTWRALIAKLAPKALADDGGRRAQGRLREADYALRIIASIRERLALDATPAAQQPAGGRECPDCGSTSGGCSSPVEPLPPSTPPGTETGGEVVGERCPMCVGMKRMFGEDCPTCGGTGEVRP